MKLHSIPGKLEVTWLEDVKAIVDTWSNYSVSLEEFKDSVLNKGLKHAKAHGGVAYIVDSGTAKGVFSQEIQSFIDSDVFPAFAKGGIKYFITITSQVSSVTKMTIKSYSAKAGPHGLKLVELNSVNDAVEWLKVNK
jgi:hypothetical protein